MVDREEVIDMRTFVENKIKEGLHELNDGVHKEVLL